MKGVLVSGLSKVRMRMSEDEKGAYGVDGCSGVTVHTVEPAGEGESTVTREGKSLSRSCEDLCKRQK